MTDIAGFDEKRGHPGVSAEAALRLHALHEQLLLPRQSLLLTRLLQGTISP
jgi:hypothetical protein